MFDLIVLGGGASGVFAAITAKENNPNASILIIEASKTPLAKVRLSGGGRCNVTHACFTPSQLVQNYPRGAKELLGLFHRFQPRDMIEWLENRGVPVHIEEDGRVFPSSNSSETIVRCFLSELDRLKIPITLNYTPTHLAQTDTGFTVDEWQTHALLIATGSSREGYVYAKQFGHSIDPVVPSLFPLNSSSSPLSCLSGLSINSVELSLKGAPWRTQGPLLITHTGFSGPAVLWLSSFAAPFLHERNYRAELIIHWCPGHTEDQIRTTLLAHKELNPQSRLAPKNPFSLPKKLWTLLVPQNLAQSSLNTIPKSALAALAHKLHADTYAIDGKAPRTNSPCEEFVQCGGVNLRELDCSTMQSRLCPGLYFSGEILNIDGVTGGFNFQNAWTTGFVAGLNATAPAPRACQPSKKVPASKRSGLR